MSKLLTIESKKITEIGNALQIIQKSTELLQWRFPATSKGIIKQVKRIGRLLPQVKEEAKP